MGGANGDGTVFEIVKTAHGYASTPKTLVSFNGNDGSQPSQSLRCLQVQEVTGMPDPPAFVFATLSKVGPQPALSGPGRTGIRRSLRAFEPPN